MFFFLLDIVFLRAWYVRRAVRRLGLEASGAFDALDAGSGFGQYSAFLCRRFPGARVLGREIDPAFVEAGNAFAGRRAGGRLRFEAADLTRMRDTEAFDLILCVDVLEHVREDAALLLRFFQALKPGGRLILTTPTVYRKDPEDGTFVEEHAHPGYSEEEIRRKTAAAGMDMLSLEYAYGFWGDLAWRLGIRNTLKLLRRGKALAPLAAVHFVLMAPLVLLLMGIDFRWNNRRGTGFVLTAGKRG